MGNKVHKVIYIGPTSYSEGISRKLGADFQVESVQAESTAVAAKITQATIILDASMKVRLDAGLLNSAKHLKLVITATTGADHIDSSVLIDRNIPLLTLATEKEFLNGITPAAELSWLLLLACARKLRSAIHHVEEGQWDREQFPGMMLRGKTLGLIGLGRIGSWMTRYGRAFDMRVIGYDPYAKILPKEVQAVELNEIMCQSDFVSVHVHLSEDTRGLLDAEQLSLMKTGAVLVNTSRGPIINENALLNGLKAGRPAALGVDVLEGEPEIKASRIWNYAKNHENVIITPHIGGFSPDALGMVLEHTANRIRSHFEHGD